MSRFTRTKKTSITKPLTTTTSSSSSKPLTARPTKPLTTRSTKSLTTRLATPLTRSATQLATQSTTQETSLRKFLDKDAMLQLIYQEHIIYVHGTREEDVAANQVISRMGTTNFYATNEVDLFKFNGNYSSFKQPNSSVTSYGEFLVVVSNKDGYNIYSKNGIEYTLNEPIHNSVGYTTAKILQEVAKELNKIKKQGKGFKETSIQ